MIVNVAHGYRDGMMKLANRLHCPSCRGRIASVSAEALGCTSCGRAIPLIDGIADFASEASSAPCHSGVRGCNSDETQFFDRMREAAGDRWPSFLGDAIVFGPAPDEAIRSIVTGRMFRNLLFIDQDLTRLQACRRQVEPLHPSLDQPFVYATLGEDQDVVGDAVADTVFGIGLLSGLSDVRSFLTRVHRVLKPNGHAAFVVPNRRFYQAMCSAMAEALVQWHARDRTWPDGEAAILNFLARTRRRLLHQGDPDLQEKHMFDTDDLQDLGEQVGFASAEVIPLDPDPMGMETIRRICRHAGANDGFMNAFAPRVGVAGHPYFSLLARRDRSASMLLWLTKAAGPTVRVFMHRPTAPGFRESEAALGGMAPRWSIELLARDTPDGIVVSLGGWCLCNTDVLWVRIALGEVIRLAPVWRPRPDVHEVLNQNGMYHALNTLCSGLESDLLFDDMHPVDRACSFRVYIQLASGTIMPDGIPDTLVMDEPMVIAH